MSSFPTRKSHADIAVLTESWWSHPRAVAFEEASPGCRPATALHPRSP